jgi:hypothetical protein
MHRLAIVAVLASLSAPAVPLAYGEPVNGFPSWQDRVLHEWTNRARCDPVKDLKGCAGCADKLCYAPMPPVVWHDGAARAARFHADEMRVQGWFENATGYSKCTLVSDLGWRYPDTCDGSAACACVGGVLACSGACTPWNGRTALFGVTGAAEVAWSGESDPNAAFYAWMYTATGYTTCDRSNSYNQQRRTTLMTTATRVGTGMAGTLAVMDFSPAGGTAVKVPSGAHYPRSGASVEAWANWYDADGPTAAGVIVDGSCTAATLQRGTEVNGAWGAVLTGLETGCHRYVFVFRDHAGALVTYPTTGSFGIGDATCPDFSTERPAVDGAICGALPACGTDPAGCYDGDPCTVDACSNGVCTHVAAADGATCSDGDACNGAETCQAGACRAGTPLICADTNACTSHACDATTGCITTNLPDGASCADATVCDGAETCQGGRCMEGAPLDCDDGNACTADSCSPATGCGHTVVSNGASCGDGDACNGAETCQAGACVAGTPLSCADADACTVDACNPLTGCTHQAVACDDGNPCTVDACDGAGGCTHVAAADGASCADADVCNGAETCQAGVCMSAARLVCDDGNPCTVDRCDAALGCAHESAPAATECSDGLACNGVEHCDGAGACVAGAACVDPPPPTKKSSGCGSTGGTGAGGPAIVVLLALLAGAPTRRQACRRCLWRASREVAPGR